MDEHRRAACRKSRRSSGQRVRLRRGWSVVLLALAAAAALPRQALSQDPPSPPPPDAPLDPPSPPPVAPGLAQWCSYKGFSQLPHWQSEACDQGPTSCTVRLASPRPPSRACRSRSISRTQDRRNRSEHKRLDFQRLGSSRSPEAAGFRAARVACPALPWRMPHSAEAAASAGCTQSLLGKGNAIRGGHVERF